MRDDDPSRRTRSLLEGQLFSRFRKKGDAKALGEVIDLVAPELLQVALHLTRDPAEAEDLVQDTLIAAMEKAERWDDARPLRPWLIGILTNRARMLRARRGRAIEPDRVTPPAPSVDPEGRAIELELDGDVEAALLRVPEAFQPVLVLRLRHHMAVPEIANALRRPPGTVRSQLQRGLEALRRLLPASYAGAFLALLPRPTRGLDAIREAVVSQAAASVAATTVATSVTGGIVVKNLVLATIAVAGIVAGRSLLTSSRVSADPIQPLPGPAVVLPPEPELAAILEPVRHLAGPGSSLTLARDAAATMLPAIPVGRGALRVRLVQESDGTPASGRLVMVEAFGERSPFYDPVTVTTDTNGEALLTDLPAGPAYVRALRGSEGPVEILAGETATITLKAWAGIAVEALVVDAEGKPVADAELWVSERFRSNLGYSVTRTDGRGRATIEGLTRTHHVAARADGFGSSLLYPVRGEPGTSVEVELAIERKAAVVRGVVRDLSGAPIEDALVYLGPESPSRTERMRDGAEIRGPLLARAHTDVSGAFEIPSIEHGEVPILVRAENFGPYRGIVHVEGDSARVDVLLAPEASVVGRVIDSEGRPTVGAQVNTTPLGGLDGAVAYTRLDGSFELVGLGAGEVTLEASSGAGRAGTVLDLTAGAEHAWEPVLVATPRITGTVRDANGAPVEGYAVVAHGPTPDDRVRSDPTDAYGRFALDDLEAQPYRIVVQEPAGWQRFPLLVIEGVEPGTEPLDLVFADPLETAGAVRIEVVHADGEAVAAGKVCFWHEELRLWREYPIDAGRASIAPVPPGTVSVEIRVPDAPWERMGSHPIEAGETLDLGRVVLSAAGSLRGSLAMRDGGAVSADANLVFLLIDDEHREGGVLQRRGDSFESGPLSPGTYILGVRGDGIVPIRTEVAIGAGEVTVHDLALEPAPTREIHIYLPEGRTAQRAWCDLRDLGGKQWWVDGNILFEDGRFTTRISAAPGEYKISAGSGPMRASKRITIAGEDPTPFEVWLE